MSNLIKPYEISVWDDIWEDGAFVEKRLGIIGTDKMNSQNRALEPNFSRNVNGVKKLTFKMYRYYYDNITGQKIENPFVGWLVSERKVKLYYEETWHDFIVKTINENSADYSYSYSLEDALVQELSKNGFGKTLDAKLMNNIGTANELAETVLEETDWEVSEDSEAFVQTIDEALVYLNINKASLPKGIEIYKIIDQTDLKSGVGQSLVYKTNSSGQLVGTDKFFGTGVNNRTILAFYSSCANQPHRFQFIYLPSLSDLKRDENRNVINDGCQYYIDFSSPASQYIQNIASYGFILPSGFSTTAVAEDGTTSVTLSAKYRGKRYGFSQQAKYVPVLDRYVNLYDKDGVEYYGYEHSEYKSPALTQNIISNTTFDSTSGWTGTHNGATGAEKAKVENVYGYFTDAGVFVDSIDELKSGVFNPADQNKDYKAYLKITFADANSVVINSGPFDNRTLIGNMELNEEWAMRYRCLNSSGEEVTNLNISLGEYAYDPGTNGYTSVSGSKISFSSFTGNPNYNLTVSGNTYTIAKVTSTSYSSEEFKKKMKVRLRIAPNAIISKNTVYYLEEIELFRATYNNSSPKTLIIPEEQGIDLEDRIIDKSYYYFLPSAVESIESAEQLIPETVTKTLSYETYKPKYNNGAQKVRIVTAKESNYFNILQSIAETFEAWLTLKITRDDPDEPGKITKKEIAFRNYAGNDNYAGFRYGVNLKDIQRTFESKNIVTKLIVKQNSNEHAKNGFCTIARAGANPTGENYIYDFQYFFNRGLLKAADYLNTMYAIDGAEGKDINPSHSSYNLQGYFPRIKNLNNFITDKNEILINTAKDLTQYKAELEIAEAGYEAANSGIEQTRNDFEALTGVAIDQISSDKIASVTLGGRYDDEETARENHGYYYRDSEWLSSLSASVTGTTINVSGTMSSTSGTERHIYVKTFPQITLEKGTKITTEYSVKCEFAIGETNGSGSVTVEVVDVNRNDVKQLLQEYAVFCGNERKYSADKETANENVGSTQSVYNSIKSEIETYNSQKVALNQKFFEKYARFIQEGTWISEEYTDDEKYYADAQSVMYNSCYPQVAYTINVVELSKLEGYEYFKYGLGDRTYIEDFEFFGDGNREKVVVAEINEVLDDPSKNTIKIQNFKNQFQDLFQKITATVQQAQYSTGSYEKAVALAEANQARKQQFLTEALDSASARLSTAGQQSVTWGNDGITVKSVNSPCDAIRMVGGAILLSKQDENGEQKWVTGVTSDGVSASLITAGILNAGEITIMNYDQPVFRWDSFGISAYDSNWYDSENGTVVSGVNSRKFVRFDKHGLYGINNAGVDGASWHPANSDDIDNKATFALTWDGLKVKNSKGVELRIGDGAKGAGGDNDLLSVHSGADRIFAITEDGSLLWGSSSTPTKVLYARTQLNTPTLKYSDYNDSNTFVEGQPTTNEWHKIKHETDWYASYSYDGGNIWTLPVLIQSAGVDRIEEKYFATDKAPSELTPTYQNTWYPSPTDAGHSAVNKYLWNYEITHYTNGTFVSSAPALIATQAKEIAEIVNFYYTTSATSSAPAKPDDGYTLTINANGEVSLTPKWKTPSARVSWKQVGGGKTETIPTTDVSQKLWNFEVVCYSDGTYDDHAVANIGTGGDSPYQLSLTNDMDSIVFNNAGECITDLPIQISCVAYEGHTQVNDPDIQVTAVNPSNKWMAGDGTTTAAQAGEKGVYEINNTIFRIHRLPADFSESTFTLTWRDKGSKVFKIKKIIALADYDLVVPQTVYNRSSGGGKVPFTVQKKDLDGTVELTSAGTEPIRAYIKKDNTYKFIDNWNGANATVSYAANDTDTDPIHIILTSNDAVLDDDAFEQSGFYRFKTEPSIIWDEEVIEFTYDGTSTICIKPRSTQKTSFTSAQWEQIKTKGASGNSPGSTAAAIPLWASFKPTSVIGLRAGNSIYVECQISDVFSTESTPTQVMVYGTITVVNTNTFSFTIDSIIFGAAKGSDANVTFDNMWSAFNGAQTDNNGIVTFTYDADGDGVEESKGIGLRADCITTGVLRVGPAAEQGKDPWHNAKFYADTENDHAVYLAGWQVTSSSLQTGEPGEAGSFAIFPLGVGAVNPSTESSFDFKNVNNVKWVMSAGTSLGITSNGALYCQNIQATGGKIGEWLIQSQNIHSPTYLGTTEIYDDNNIPHSLTRVMALMLKGNITNNTQAYLGRPSLMSSFSNYFEPLNDEAITSVWQPFYIGYDGNTHFENLRMYKKGTGQDTKYGYDISYLGMNLEHPQMKDYFLYTGYKEYSRSDFIASLKDGSKDRYTNATPTFCIKLDGTGFLGSLKIGEVDPTNPGHTGLISNNGRYSNGFVNYGDEGEDAAFWVGAAIDVGGKWCDYTPWEIKALTASQGAGEEAWKDFVPFYVLNNGHFKAESGNIGNWSFSGNTLLSPGGKMTISNGSLIVGETVNGVLKGGSLSGDRQRTTLRGAGDLRLWNSYTDGLTITTSSIQTSYYTTRMTYGGNYSASKGATFTVIINETPTEDASLIIYWACSSQKHEVSGYKYLTIKKGQTQYTFNLTDAQLQPRAFWVDYMGFSLVNEDNAKAHAGQNKNAENIINLDKAWDMPFLNDFTTTSGGSEKSYAYSVSTGVRSTVQSNAHIVPTLRECSLGLDGKPWLYLYVNNLVENNTWSDIRLKQGISGLSEEYERLFDLIEPARYQYIDGESGRFHTGFIAQQVVSALTESGLSTYDFAALCQYKNEESSKNGYWYLRRDEFVALNTWQIQKTKARVTSIEEKLLACEAKISSLEQEIENLKNR